MSNGYGYGGSGGSSGSSSSRNTTSQSTTPQTPDAQNVQANQARVAPPGYHYMPDGSLMSDAEHARLYNVDDPSVLAEVARCYECLPGPNRVYGCKHTSSFQGSRPAGCRSLAQCSINCNPERGVERIASNFLTPNYNPFEQQSAEIEEILAQKYKTAENSIKTIKSFNIDYSDIKASGETRGFVITADEGAKFKLEVKNEDGHYYNFFTNSFSATISSLKRVVESGTFKGYIKFPKITDNDQYDIYLYAEENTNHANYEQVRFEDGSLDLNNSIGSTSFLMQKVLYQYVDLTLTLSTFSPNSTIETGSQSNATVTTSRNLSSPSVAFSVACSVSTATKSYQIIKQPLEQDILGYLSLTVGSAPENLPGEDVYPTLTTNFNAQINGDFTAGTSDKIVIDGTDLGDSGDTPFPKVGDKILASISPAASVNKTVNGAVTSGVKVVMDDNVADIMAVGDKIVSYAGGHALDNKLVTVVALNPDGDNVKEFSMSEAVALADGLALTFERSVNHNLTTVIAIDPDGDNANEIQLSAARGFVDNTSVGFYNRKNFQWPLNNIVGLKEGAKLLAGTNVTASSSIANYKDTVKIFENTEQEQTIIKNKAEALTTKSQKPTITNGLVTTQPGNVVFDKQQSLALSGDTIKIGSYGLDGIFDLYGYQVRFTDLAVTLTTVTTTTTSAVNSSTTVPVASVNGIMPSTSTISGIGIDSYSADPTVQSRSVTSGAGNLTLSAAQTLESGATLTVGNTGQTINITGNIEILKSGTANQTIYFDVEKLVSIT